MIDRVRFGFSRSAGLLVVTALMMIPALALAADAAATKPAEAPANKPADAPAAKSAEAPATKPADPAKPADTVKPTEAAPATKATDAAKPAEAAKPADAAAAAKAAEDAKSAEAAKAAPAAAPAAAPVPDPSRQPIYQEGLSDELAGKSADVAKIGTSPADGSNPYLGPKEAPVVVNIFSDFQCPVCKRSADPIKQLVLDFPGAVKVVFRNNALDMHHRAKYAAIAALAAGRQGKFWQYHDRLFANQSALDDGSLRLAAQDLGLDMAKWDADILDPKLAESVKQDAAAAVSLGAPGTPSFFINGQRQVGWGSYRGLRDMVARELKRSEELVSAGTPTPQIQVTRVRANADKNIKMPNEGAVDPDTWVKLLTVN